MASEDEAVDDENESQLNAHPPTIELLKENRSNLELLLSRLDGQRFADWYRRREFARSIREGRGPSARPDDSKPEQQSPSRLLRCHRQEFYRRHDAPVEARSPEGVLWYGARVETDVVLPFLRDIAGLGFFVRDSVWVDYSIFSNGQDLQFRGATDPVFVDAESRPQLLTEIKTVESISHLDAPRPHHRAQVHAYLRGLSLEYERDVRNAVVLYVKRDNLAMRTFQVTFDPEFWEEVVLEWAETNTEYRSKEELPPANPEHSWECRYCDYRNRCGRTDAPYSDTGSTGLLPLTDTYPRTRLSEYLRAFSRAQVTPTIAHHHPDLAAAHGAYDWECPVCGGTVGIFEVDWDGDVDRPPQCPDCGDRGVVAELVGPSPEDQIVEPREGDD